MWESRCTSHEYSCGVQNIDTDQIIPAEYLTLVPSKVSFMGSVIYQAGGEDPTAACMSSNFATCVQPEEYEKLGSYALIGLPTELYEKRCVALSPSDMVAPAATAHARCQAACSAAPMQGSDACMTHPGSSRMAR